MSLRLENLKKMSWEWTSIRFFDCHVLTNFMWEIEMLATQIASICNYIAIFVQFADLKAFMQPQSVRCFVFAYIVNRVIFYLHCAGAVPLESV